MAAKGSRKGRPLGLGKASEKPCAFGPPDRLLSHSRRRAAGWQAWPAASLFRASPHVVLRQPLNAPSI